MGMDEIAVAGGRGAFKRCGRNAAPFAWTLRAFALALLLAVPPAVAHDGPLTAQLSRVDRWLLLLNSELDDATDLPDFLYQQDRETTAWVGSNPVGVLGG